MADRHSLLLHDVIDAEEGAFPDVQTLVSSREEAEIHHGVPHHCLPELEPSSIPIPPNYKSSEPPNVLPNHSSSSAELSCDELSFIPRLDSSEGPDSLLFTTPPTAMGRSVNVYKNCQLGRCHCNELLDGEMYQLKPCRLACIMFPDINDIDVNVFSLFEKLVDGVSIVDSVPAPYTCNNYRSILDPSVKGKMDDIVRKELSEGCISLASESPHCIHALGAVPKPDGNIRPITDCSRPVGHSVNFHCASLVKEFHYLSIDDVTDMLLPGDFLAVVDIKAAYRAVVINPDHRKFVGFRWQLDGVEYEFTDNRLCFGLHSGPCCFNEISSFLASILRDRCNLQIVQYLDDFICLGRDFDECQAAQNCIIALLRFVGFYISWSKLRPPARQTIFLGIVIDSERMELRLPEGKLYKLQTLLEQHRNAKYISKKALECLTGLLNHCSTIVKGGRVFCRRLYDTYKVMCNKQLNRIKLGWAAQLDLQWWFQFSRVFNGRGAIANPEYPHALVSDASLKGFGVYLQSDWLIGVWPHVEYKFDDTDCHHVGEAPCYDNVDYSNINVLELWPILLGLKRWYTLLAHKSVLIYTDNTQVKCMLRKGMSSNKTCMSWLREIYWLCVIYDIQLLPRYISTSDNTLADALSRAPYSSDSYKDTLINSGLCCMDSFAFGVSP